MALRMWEMDIPPDTFPGRLLLPDVPPAFFAYPDISPPPLCTTSAWVAFLFKSDVVDGMQLGAARLRYRRGGGRRATDAASDLLQRLTTTATAAPLFPASRCVRCRRCSQCPPGTCMSPRWTATTGRSVE